MSKEKMVVFRCDEKSCRKSITNRKHIKIVMGFNSGWMVPPYIARMPAAPIADRSLEKHFCKVECFTRYFETQIHEAHTRWIEAGSPLVALREKMLEAVSPTGSRMSGEADDGTRDDSRRSAGERILGVDDDMRVRTLGGSVSGRGDSGQEDQRVASTIAYRELGRGGSEVSAPTVAAASKVSQFIIRCIQAARAQAWAVMP